MDGLYFTKVAGVNSSKEHYLHKFGCSTDQIGHQDSLKPEFVSYAYGPILGDWNT